MLKCLIFTYSEVLEQRTLRVVVFLFVLIKLFSLGITAEPLRPNVDWKSAFLKAVGQFRPKFQVEENNGHFVFLAPLRTGWSLQATYAVPLFILG